MACICAETISVIKKTQQSNVVGVDNQSHTSALAEGTAALSASRSPLYTSTEASRKAVFAAWQNAVSQSGELRGEVYPAEEVGRGVVELHLDVILLLYRLLVVVDVDGTDGAAGRFHARHVLVRFDGAAGRIGTVTAEER